MSAELQDVNAIPLTAAAVKTGFRTRLQNYRLQESHANCVTIASVSAKCPQEATVIFLNQSKRKFQRKLNSVSILSDMLMLTGKGYTGGKNMINTILITASVMCVAVAVATIVTVISYCKGVKKNESKVSADKKAD